MNARHGMNIPIAASFAIPFLSFWPPKIEVEMWEFLVENDEVIMRRVAFLIHLITPILTSCKSPTDNSPTDTSHKHHDRNPSGCRDLSETGSNVINHLSPLWPDIILSQPLNCRETGYFYCLTVFPVIF